MRPSQLIIVFAILTCSVLQAKELTLGDAISLAEENNTTLRASRSSQKIAQISLYSAQSAFQPSLTAGVNAAHVKHLESQAYQASWGADLSLVERLQMSTNATIEEKNANLKATAFATKATADELHLQVVSAFLQALRDSLLIDLQRANDSTQQAKLQQAKDFLSAGTGTELEILQQQTLIANAQLALVEAKRVFEDSRTALLELLGSDSLSVNTPLRVISPNAFDTIEAWKRNDQQQSDTASNNENLAQQARITAARAALKASKYDYWPTLQFGASLAHNDPIIANPSMSMSSSQTLKLEASLQIALLDQNTRASNIQTNQVQIEDASEKLRSLALTNQNSNFKALRTFTSSLERYRASRSAVESAQRLLDASIARKTLGLISALELRDAEYQLQQAQTSVIESQYTVLTAFVTLRKTQNSLDEAIQVLSEE